MGENPIVMKTLNNLILLNDLLQAQGNRIIMKYIIGISLKEIIFGAIIVDGILIALMFNIF